MDQSILILGNGFDRQFGLETTYTEFFKWLLENSNSIEYIKFMKQVNDTIFSFKEFSTSESLLNTFDLLESFSGISNGILTYPFSDNYYTNLFIFIAIDHFDGKSFSSLDSMFTQDFRWCDIEDLLLQSVRKSVLLEMIENYKNGSLVWDSFVQELETSFIWDDLKDGFLFDKVLYFNALISLIRKSKSNSSKTPINIISEISLLDSHYLLKCLNELESNFRTYLDTLLADFNSTLIQPFGTTNNIRNLCNASFEDIYHKSLVNDNPLYILNFNYTNTFSTLYHCSIDNRHGFEMIYVHDNTHPIFGIDLMHANQENPRHYINKFTKSFRKVDLSIHATHQLPNVVNRISFYGHSLSKMDYSYFQSLFDRYDLYSSMLELNFFVPEKLVLIEQLKIAVFDLLLSYGSLFLDSNKGRNLVNKMLLENRITFTKVVDINELLLRFKNNSINNK